MIGECGKIRSYGLHVLRVILNTYNVIRIMKIAWVVIAGAREWNGK